MKRATRPNDAKLRELIRIISEWCQADPCFGAIKLNKLLFHADFSAFLALGDSITGQEYFALPQGPAPKRLKPITEKMKQREDLAYKEVLYYGHAQKRPIALRPPDLSIFSGEEIGIVRQTIEKFWKMNASDISEQSHLFLGWKTARLREVIPYATALISCRQPTLLEREHGRSLENLAKDYLRAHRQN